MSVVVSGHNKNLQLFPLAPRMALDEPGGIRYNRTVTNDERLRVPPGTRGRFSFVSLRVVGQVVPVNSLDRFLGVNRSRTILFRHTSNRKSITSSHGRPSVRAYARP